MIAWKAISSYPGPLEVPDLVVSDVIRIVVKMSFLKHKSNCISSCFSHCLRLGLAQSEKLSAYFVPQSTSFLTLLIFLLWWLRWWYPAVTGRLTSDHSPLLFGDAQVAWFWPVQHWGRLLEWGFWTRLLFSIWKEKKSLGWQAFCPWPFFPSSHLKAGEAAVILRETRTRNSPAPQGW